MTRDLFDRKLRRLRRDNAVRRGIDGFLFDRAFDDTIDRLTTVPRRFGCALLIGAASARWAEALNEKADAVDVFNPAPALAKWSGEEDRSNFGVARYDLVVAVGTLDTVNDLPRALLAIRKAMTGDALLIGALAGGDSLPALRHALLSADRAEGKVAARVHPRIDGPTLTQLLTAGGFVMPVVDIDRVTLRYRTLADLVRDLRAMGTTNMLAGPRTPLTRQRWAAATTAFEALAVDGRTEERIDILHFLGWTSPQG